MGLGKRLQSIQSPAAIREQNSSDLNIVYDAIIDILDENCPFSTPLSSSLSFRIFPSPSIILRPCNLEGLKPTENMMMVTITAMYYVASLPVIVSKQVGDNLRTLVEGISGTTDLVTTDTGGKREKKISLNEEWNKTEDLIKEIKDFSRFLDASLHLYKRVCPSVGPSVCRFVGPLVRRSVIILVTLLQKMHEIENFMQGNNQEGIQT